MTELQFYKFINDNTIEYHWETNEGGERDVIILPNICFLEELGKLCETLFDDEGIEIRWKGTYVGIWASDICKYYDIELVNIFGEEE